MKRYLSLLKILKDLTLTNSLKDTAKYILDNCSEKFDKEFIEFCKKFVECS